MKEVKGIVCLLPTVFNKDGSLDIAAYKENIRYLENAGMHCITAVASNGEYFLTNFEEFKQIAVAAREACEKMTCIIGTHWQNTREAIRRTKFAEEIGADAVLMIPPYYSNWLDAESCYAHYKAIHDATSKIQIVFYNYQGAGFTADISLYDRFMQDFPRMTATKECTPAIEMGELVRKHGKRLNVLTGSDTVLYLCMLLGGVGAVGVHALAYPKFILKFYDACLNRRWDEAKEYDNMLNFHMSKRVPGKYHMSIKALAIAAGLNGGFARPPYEDVSQRDIDFHREWLKEIGEL